MFCPKYSTTQEITQQLKEAGLKVFKLEDRPDHIRAYVPLGSMSRDQVARQITRTLPGALVDSQLSHWLLTPMLGFAVPKAYPESSIGLATPLACFALPAPSPAAIRAWKAQRDVAEMTRFLLGLGKELARHASFLTVYAIGRDGQCILSTSRRDVLVIRTDGNKLTLTEYIPDAAFYRNGQRGASTTYDCRLNRDALFALLQDHVADHNRLAGCTAPAPRTIPQPSRLPNYATVGG